MTKDEIRAKIAECEEELKTVKSQINPNGQSVVMPLQRLSDLNARQGELIKEISGLKAMLEEE